MSPEVWAEQVRRMKNGARFRWSYAPYLLEPYQSIFDTSVLETVLAMFSRAGKSEIVLNAIGYCIDQDPRRILVMWPTIELAELWSKDNLTGELFDETPCLHYLGSEAKARTASQTLLHKLFPGGLLDLFGANVAGRMRRAKGNFLYEEEIDAIKTDQAGEGDPGMIFAKRGDEYPDTIRVKASYPGRDGQSRIWSALGRTDWRQWFVRCVRCGGEPYVMDREAMLRFDRDDPAGAKLECPRCHEFLNDAERYQMMLAGAWKGTRPFRGRRGYQANSLLWPHAIDPKKFPGGYLQMLAEQVIAVDTAKDPEEARRVLVTASDSIPYKTVAERTKPKAETLYERRENYGNPGDGEQALPAGVCYITSGGDTQDDRLEAQIIGWGVGEESWVLGYIVEIGDTQKPDVYRRMRERLEALSFIHPFGPSLRIAKHMQDVRRNREQGRAFCAAFKTIRAFPVAGINGYGEEIITRSKRQKKALWIVAAVPATQLLYSRFAAGGSGPGAVHFAHWLDMEYFRQVTSEHEQQTFVDGHEVIKYVCPPHVSNEALDTFKYALSGVRHGPPHVNLERLAQRLRDESKPVEQPTTIEPAKSEVSTLERTMATLRGPRPRRSSSFATVWRR